MNAVHHCVYPCTHMCTHMCTHTHTQYGKCSVVLPVISWKGRCDTESKPPGTVAEDCSPGGYCLNPSCVPHSHRCWHYLAWSCSSSEDTFWSLQQNQERSPSALFTSQHSQSQLGTLVSVFSVVLPPCSSYEFLFFKSIC